MSGRGFSVILVFSTSHALKGEKLLAGEGIGCELVPVPRHLSSDCGVCIKVLKQNGERARDLLAGAGVELQGLYEL